jgi:hypothetical protein
MLTSANKYLIQLSSLNQNSPPARDTYTIVDENNKEVDKLGIYSNILSANIKTGILDAQKIVANYFESITANISSVNTNVLNSLLINTSDLISTGSATLNKIIAQNTTSTVLNTNILAPIPDSDLIIDLNNQNSSSASSFSKLVVKGNENKPIAAIDANGNATFSGQLSSSSIVSDLGDLNNLTVKESATIDGTLRVNRLEANEIVGLKASFADLLSSSVSATNITNITNVTRITEITKIIDQISTVSGQPPAASSDAATPSQTPTPTMIDQQSSTTSASTPTPILLQIPSSSSASLIDRLYNIINDSNASISSQLSDLPPDIVNMSINLADSLSQKPIIFDKSIDVSLFRAKEGTFYDSLKVLGSTILGNTTVAGNFLQDGTLSLSNGNQIDVINGTLYLQKMAMGGVDILNGKITITQNGDVNISENLIVQKNISASNISPLPGQTNLTINLGSGSPGNDSFGRLLINNQEGATVASVDTSGNATFSGQLASSSIVVSGTGDLNNLKVENIASVSGQLTAGAIGITQVFADSSNNNSTINAGSATIGKGIIVSGQTYVVIQTTKITENSLIYVTPTSSTNGQIPFVADIVPGSSFKVQFDNAIETDAKFNWWIVN